jgi:hypothetical protein
LADDGGLFDNREGALEGSRRTNAGRLAGPPRGGRFTGSETVTEVRRMAPPRGKGLEALKTE